MGSYDVQQVCLNGHQITDCYRSSPQHGKKYCDKCGAITITECQNCHAPIKGYYDVDGVISFGRSTDVPTHCEQCGKPYPWAAEKHEDDSIQPGSDKQRLNPWLVILSCLNDLSSDKIIEIALSAGLNLDLNLSEAQGFSNLTRNRVFIPRIQEEYSKLSEENKLVVAYRIAEGIIQQNPDNITKVNDSLLKIGWTATNGRLSPADLKVKELFFPKGSPHDAYIEIRKIITSAISFIYIIDPWVDSTVFTILACNAVHDLKINILSNNLSADFILEAEKYRKQYTENQLMVKKTNEFHDRFIILDEKRCYHIGASIKDAGNRAFMISKIEDDGNKAALLTQFKESWEKSTEIK